MGDYGYQRGSYDYKPQERAMGSWDNANNRYDTNSYGYGETGFGNIEGPRDHVCRPVIVDAQGRKRPFVLYGQNNPVDGFVHKTETVIEQVRTYGNGLPNVGPMKDYGVQNDGWVRPINPPRERPPMKTIISTTNWRQTPNNTGNGYGGTNGYGGNYDNGANGWNKPNNGYEGNYDNGYGGNYDNGANGWNKPSIGFDPYHNVYEGSKETTMENMQEPKMITSGGWIRPNHSAWSSPPIKESPLTRATNDIGTVVEYLQDAAKPASVMAPGPRFAIPTPTVQTIDSREARKRYGGGVTMPQVAKTTYDYKSAIDSREAAKRYGGQLM